MVFSSAVFLLLFLPLTLLLYFAAPKKLKNGLLFLVSLLFYAWGEPVYILIMLFSIVFGYGNGLLLEHFDRKGKVGARTTAMVLSVAVNISLLCFFKYGAFMADNINALFGTALTAPVKVLPIGISFYTFQTISYTIDVYRRKVMAQHNIVSFGMYICMFPQLIAGPVVRYSDIEREIPAENRPFDEDRLLKGIVRFILGLSKKVLLANAMGEIWTRVLSEQGNMSALTALIGAAAFTLQIYFDFSGYSDMAIGIGHMLGFTFPENFDYPYESKSITEFWRRWHMTLGTWFREYLYIPLGGNQKGLPRQLLNLVIVWLLSGLWHGAGWNFILWGLYFFVLLALEKLFLLRVLEKAPAWSRHLYTMFFMVQSWVLFACDDLTLLPKYLASLFGARGAWDNTGLFLLREYAMPLLLGAVLSLSLVSKLTSKILSALGEKNKTLQFSLTAFFALTGYAASLIMVINGSYNPFLYFRF